MYTDTHTHVQKYANTHKYVLVNKKYTSVKIQLQSTGKREQTQKLV